MQDEPTIMQNSFKSYMAGLSGKTGWLLCSRELTILEPFGSHNDFHSLFLSFLTKLINGGSNLVIYQSIYCPPCTWPIWRLTPFQFYQARKVSNNGKFIKSMLTRSNQAPTNLWDLLPFTTGPARQRCSKRFLTECINSPIRSVAFCSAPVLPPPPSLSLLCVVRYWKCYHWNC